MIYLFKQIYNSEDVFRHLYVEMVYRGYECYHINDDLHPDPRSFFDKLKGEKITLITADHMDLQLNKKCYKTKELIRVLKPVKSVFTMHDLAIHAVTDDLSQFDVILLPHDNWKGIFKHKNVKISGYPRFVHAYRTTKYKAIFFVSSVYVLLERCADEVLQNFRFFIENNIAFKFPKFKGIEKLEAIISNNGGIIINNQIESFKLLLETDIAFSNASSSICIEASIAGCHSINMGYSLENFYNCYGVHNHLSFTRQDLLDYSNTPTPPPKLDHLFDIESAIQHITS